MSLINHELLELLRDKGTPERVIGFNDKTNVEQFIDEEHQFELLHLRMNKEIYQMTHDFISTNFVVNLEKDWKMVI